MNERQVCAHCEKPGHEAATCRLYWCTLCEEMGKCGTKGVNPLGHTKSRCRNRKCEKCGYTNHNTDECKAVWCDYCTKQENEGVRVNPIGHTSEECYNRKAAEEQCERCHNAWHFGTCPEKCTKCGRWNHTANNCWNDKTNPCKKCGKTGHPTERCRT